MKFINNFFAGFFVALLIAMFFGVETAGGILIIISFGYLFLSSFKFDNSQNWNISDDPNFQIDPTENKKKWYKRWK